MSETETQQQSIFGNPLEEQLHIETSGRVIRPWKRMLDQIADEYRITATADGLEVCVVDVANVQMIQSTLHATAFDAYDHTGEFTIGVSGDVLGSALQHARYGKSSDDAVTITADSAFLETDVTRELAGTEADMHERVGLIDPDSVRSEPDIPDLEFDAAVELDPQAVIEAVSVLETTDNDDVRIVGGDGHIEFRQTDDVRKRSIRLHAGVDGDADAIFSGTYIQQLAKALEVGYVDSLRLRWSDEYPIFAEFEREGVYAGTIMIAPRVEG